MHSGLVPGRASTRTASLMVVFILWTTVAVAGVNEDLMRAVNAGDLSAVKNLVAKGADVNAENKFGETPLRIAAKKGHKVVAQLLLEKGADVNAKDNAGTTPLHIAAGYASANGREDVAQLLLDRGAHINAKNNYGSTPLHIAAGTDRKDVAQLLLDKGADVNAKDNYGKTPLYYARKIRMPRHKHEVVSSARLQDYKDMAQLLRKHGGHE